MRKIFKYPIEITDEQKVLLPKGAEILCVRLNDNNLMAEICMYALIDVEEEVKEERSFFVFGTGHLIEDSNIKYIGTFQKSGFVGHLFENL